jgi:hypothetical protein
MLHAYVKYDLMIQGVQVRSSRVPCFRLHTGGRNEKQREVTAPARFHWRKNVPKDHDYVMFVVQVISMIMCIHGLLPYQPSPARPVFLTQQAEASQVSEITQDQVLVSYDASDRRRAHPSHHCQPVTLGLISAILQAYKDEYNLQVYRAGRAAYRMQARRDIYK